MSVSAIPNELADVLGPVNGVKEIEAKILRVDSDRVRKRLDELGASSSGTFDIVEQRYFPSELMMEHDCSTRLRKLTGEGRVVVERVLKIKKPDLCIPGHKKLGERLKHRIEIELALENTIGTECRFDLMRAMLRMDGLKERDLIETERVRFTLGDTKYEFERILSYVDERGNATKGLPPEFLEIEVRRPRDMIEAVQSIGYILDDLTPLTKRDLCRRRKTS